MSPDSGDEAHVSRGGAVTSGRDYLFIIHRRGIEKDMAVAADMRGEEGWWYYYIRYYYRSIAEKSLLQNKCELNSIRRVVFSFYG